LFIPVEKIKLNCSKADNSPLSSELLLKRTQKINNRTMLYEIQSIIGYTVLENIQLPYSKNSYEANILLLF
jgi:hypothetical protein